MADVIIPSDNHIGMMLWLVMVSNYHDIVVMWLVMAVSNDYYIVMMMRWVTSNNNHVVMNRRRWVIDRATTNDYYVGMLRLSRDVNSSVDVVLLHMNSSVILLRDDNNGLWCAIHWCRLCLVLVVAISHF